MEVMSLQTMLVIILTILASVALVSVIILLGWFLIWKAFLSKFRLVRELLGHTAIEDETLTNHQANNKHIQEKESSTLRKYSKKQH